MDLALITLLTLVASAVGTMTGFGTSTIMVPVLAAFLPLPETLLLVGIIHWFGNIWKMLLFRGGLRWWLILAFGIPGIVCSILGGAIVPQAPEALLARVLGVLLIGYVAFLLVKERFKLPRTTPAAMIGGALSGFFAGVFGIGGAVRGAFLAAFDPPKAVYIATAGAIGLAADTGRLGVYLAGGIGLDRALLLGLLVFIPSSFAGAKVAERIVDRLPQQHFRTVIALFLCLVALRLLLLPL